MLKFLKLLIPMLIIFSYSVAYADVAMVNEVIKREDCIYVVGNPDLYPIEYYNNNNHCFDGLMPRILEEISENTGIDFVYYYDENKSQSELLEDSKAELVHAYAITDNPFYHSDTVTVLTYNSSGEEINVGWRFTKYADEEFINIFRDEIAKIDETKLNSLFLEFYDIKSGYTFENIVVLIVFLFVLALMVIVFLINIRKTNEKMSKNEITDSDTGIGNLAYFEKCFINFSDKLSYILYIIVDSNYLQVYHDESTFKEVLKFVADTLKSFEAKNGITARITENGFALAFECEDDETSKKYIQNILKQLSEYWETDNYEKQKYFRMVSYKLKPEDQNCELLLFNLRKNCTNLIGSSNVYYECSEKMMNSAVEKKAFLDEIINGFETKEFKLYLQFIFDNKTKKIVSAEALSRWERDGKILAMPGQYIGFMEETGIITTLDYYMFEQTCMQLHKWKDTEFDDISISCNFTRITLSEKKFFEKIKEISNRYVFDKSKIIIEITEDAIEKNREMAVNNILKCKTLGFRIALDDFGSGYTSLTNLCDYPVDIVKLDRSILLKGENANGRDLITGIIALVHNLDLIIVCEGVETKEQDKFVSETDCDLVQGWYYTKPSSINVAEEFYINN